MIKEWSLVAHVMSTLIPVCPKVSSRLKLCKIHSSRCIRKQHCTVLSTKACSGDTRSVSLALEGHRQGNGSDVKHACAYSDAFRQDPTLGVLLSVGLPLENEASCQRCAPLVPTSGCFLAISQRLCCAREKNKSTQSLLHHSSPSLSTLMGYFQ